MSDIEREVDLRLDVVLDEIEATIARWGASLEAGRDELREAAHALAAFRDQRGVQRAIEIELTRAASALDATLEALDPETHERERGAVTELSGFLSELRQLAIDRLAARGREPEIPIVAFMASRGVPRVHGGLVVPVPRALPVEGPWDAADDDEFVEASSAPSLPAAVADAPELAERAALARDVMEDLASLGTLRTLYDHEPWGQAEAFEERLLVAYDYLVALERPYEGAHDPSSPRAALGVVERLYRHATDFTVPDAGRSFALGFVLSSIAPSTARTWLSISLRRAHDRALPAYVDALSLGASPEVNDVCRAILSEGARVELVTMALDVLHRRGHVDQPLVVALAAHPDARVVGRAARALARASVDVSAPILARLLDGPEEVAAHALESLAVLGAQLVQPFARDSAAGSGLLARRALEILAFSGGARDKDQLLERALADTSLLRLVALVGTVAHAERLAEEHERETDVSRREALAAALGTLLGPHGSARARLRELGLPREARVRGGAVFGGVDALVATLRDPATPQGHRRILARELTVVRRAPLPFDVEGWVSAQRAALGG